MLRAAARLLIRIADWLDPAPARARREAEQREVLAELLRREVQRTQHFVPRRSW